MVWQIGTAAPAHSMSVTITCHYFYFRAHDGPHDALLVCPELAQLWGVQSNRWAQTALRPLRVPPTHACIQTLSLYRPHTAHTDGYTKDSCPYLPTFKPGLITSQSSVTQWALDNKSRGVGDHNFTELHKKGSFIRTNKPSYTMMVSSPASSQKFHHQALMLWEHNITND